MLKQNTLSTHICVLLSCISLSAVSTVASAAQNANTQTLPVRHVDNISNIINNSEYNYQKTTAAETEVNDQTDDEVIVLDDETQNTDIATPNNLNTTSIAPTTTDTAEATLNNDINDEATDDINDGQAVEGGNNDESTIDSIENNNVVTKNGKVYTTLNLSNYAKTVNESQWSPNMKVNSAMTVKLQTLLDWNHASPGPIDGGWGMNSKKALTNFQAMHGLKQTGKMNQQTWNALTKNIDINQPVLVEYTLTKADVNTNFAATPAGAEAKSKMKGLYYQNIIEMLGERFHMDVRYLEKLNKNKEFKAGETITVINVGAPLQARITRVVADKAAKTLYAYNGNKLVATYPTTVGSSSTPSPHGTYRIVNKVKMPWYKATVGSDADKQVFMLPPGPNNPVGVVWMGLSKPSYGLHGSPKPEGISRQASHGCIRLTNWDVLEVYANIEKGASVELK